MAQLGNTIVNGALRVLGEEFNQGETIDGNLNVTTINGVTVGSSPKFTDNDTKVTSVGNHYTPTTTTTKSATGGTVTDIANSSSGVQVMTGVQMDAAGHVMGVTSVALKSTNSTYNFSGTTFVSGNKDTGSHDANATTANGHYYYSSNGPTTAMGASTNDGALFVSSHSGSWVAQIAQDYRNGNIFVRGKNNGTWQTWKKPDAGSVNGYTVATSVPSGAVFTDTKVTAVGNHYTPTCSGTFSANASGATAAWSIDVVKGVTLEKDAAGHITAVKVTSGKIPANPNTDTKVTSVGNHYTPTCSTSKSASGGTLTDITNSSSGVQVMTGVQMDAAGHVTGVNSVALKSVNSWRGIQNNLTSDSTSDSLSAAQGKALANGSARDSTKVAKAGDTMTGRLTMSSKPINQIVAGTGTAAQDKGSGVSPRYFPARWAFNMGIATPTHGDIITIKIPVAGHDYGVFISTDNGTTYKPVTVAPSGTSRLTTHYGNGALITLIYDSAGGTNSVYAAAGADARSNITGGCWRVVNYYDTGNTYDRNRYNCNILAWGTKILNANIIVAANDGKYHHLKEGTAFDIRWPILYLNADCNANATTTNTYDIIHFTITTTQSISLTAYKPVFIKGTLSGTTFTPVSTAPLTQTVPSAWDGYAYILLGMATTATTVYLQEKHPIYKFYSGVFREWNDLEGYDLKASGAYSHAEGYGTTASADHAHSEGNQTAASGKYSHAEGILSKATADHSHAEGYQTTASGTVSHAEGYQTKAGNYSHSEGANTTASGQYAHSEGNQTLASGEDSHAEGIYTKATGTVSHAEGQFTSAIGWCAHAEGHSTSAANDYDHAEGLGSTAKNSSSHAEGYYTLSSGHYSHAEGQQATATGQGSHAEGAETVASGSTSHAEGLSTTASSDNTHSEGCETVASGSTSHAEGYQSKALNQQSHAEGWQTTANGNYSHTECLYTKTTAGSAHAEGRSTLASAEAAHAEGYNTTSSNCAAHSGGHWNAAMTTGGAANNTTGTALVIGNGTGSGTLKNAFSVQYSGVVKAASTITASTTADYAEYFEWADENPNNEDRVGYFIAFDSDNKIKIGSNLDEYILGVSSGEPFVLGNGDCDVWNGMVLRDEFRRVIYEPAPKLDEEEKPMYDEQGNPLYQGTRPKINPKYDPTIPYINRADRPEWQAVGMLGVLAVRDNGTCQINSYCSVASDGTAKPYTNGDIHKYRVIHRNSQNVIEIVFR